MVEAADLATFILEGLVYLTSVVPHQETPQPEIATCFLQMRGPLWRQRW